MTAIRHTDGNDGFLSHVPDWEEIKEEFHEWVKNSFAQQRFGVVALVLSTLLLLTTILVCLYRALQGWNFTGF